MLRSPDAPLLRSLEDLAALSEKQGILEVKPFKRWKDKRWKNRIFSLRICNSGEVLDIYEFLDTIPKTAREHATKIEFIVRSIVSVDGVGLASEEELAAFNTSIDQELSKLEYLRLWARNLEHFVLDHFYLLYSALQLKQMRQVQGEALCDSCGQVFVEDTLPEESKEIFFSTSEIVCGPCLKLGKINEENYDFEKEVARSFEKLEEEKPKEETQVSVKKEPGYNCNFCNKEFEELEELTTHREACESEQNKEDSLHK